MKIVVLLDNLRSVHNVGSIIRSAEVFGAEKVICAGYTPYPEIRNDHRLPHLIERQTNQIRKTSLGAEKMIGIEYYSASIEAIDAYRSKGYRICAVEIDSKAVSLTSFHPGQSTVLIFGNEVDGVNHQVLRQADQIIQIPQYGDKESLSVSVAAAITLYELAKVIHI